MGLTGRLGNLLGISPWPFVATTRSDVSAGDRREATCGTSGAWHLAVTLEMLRTAGYTSRRNGVPVGV